MRVDGLVEVNNFAGHYVEWRAKRISEIFRVFGDIKGRSFLELACGYGEIGSILQENGATVTFSEGRSEHVAVLRDRFDPTRVEQVDLEEGIVLSRSDLRFDVVLHLGVLYHLEDPWPSIRDSARLGKVVLIESECLPAMLETSQKVEEAGYDQALHGRSTRLSPVAIEGLLRRAKLSFVRLRSPRLDTGFHHYSGRLTRDAVPELGFRRMWLAYPKGSEASVKDLLHFPHLSEAK